MPEGLARGKPESGHEGNHPGGRIGDPPLPDHPGHQQTTAAGLRQADDLLPALDLDAGGYPRDPPDLDPRGYRQFRARARRWRSDRDLDPLRSAAPSRRPGPG